MTAGGTTATVKILSAMELFYFLCAPYNVTPPSLKKAMIYLSNFSYVTELSADVEGLSLHVIMRCMEISSTFHSETYT